MRIPVDTATRLLKLVGARAADADAPVRVAVYVDASASDFLVDAVRGALVPRTVTGMVRVQRLAPRPEPPRDDTDAVIVLTCGSDGLEDAVHRLVTGGAPVAVLAESAVEAPFIESDTRALGLIAATDRAHLLGSLARWILDRTDKPVALAATFPFMRLAAARRTVASCALANAATGALAFVPGADFPAMTLAQAGMALELAAMYGKPLAPERGYELAGVLAGALALRAAARALAARAGRAGFVVKAGVAAAGSVAMGCALMALYARDVDYAPVNAAVASAVARVRGAGRAPEAGPARAAA